MDTALDLGARTDWWVEAACRGLNPNLFHPDPGDTTTIREARRICAGCPVQHDCLLDGFDNPRDIRAGMTGPERQQAQRCIWCNRPHPQPQLGSDLCATCWAEHHQRRQQRLRFAA